MFSCCNSSFFNMASNLGFNSFCSLSSSIAFFTSCFLPSKICLNGFEYFSSTSLSSVPNESSGEAAPSLFRMFCDFLNFGWSVGALAFYFLIGPFGIDSSFLAAVSTWPWFSLDYFNSIWSPSIVLATFWSPKSIKNDLVRPTHLDYLDINAIKSALSFCFNSFSTYCACCLSYCSRSSCLINMITSNSYLSFSCFSSRSFLRFSISAFFF